MVGAPKRGSKTPRPLRILVHPGVDARASPEHIFRLALSLAERGHWITVAAPKNDLPYFRGIKTLALGNSTAHHEPIALLQSSKISAGKASSLLGKAMASHYEATFSGLDRVGHAFDAFVCEATCMACRDVAQFRGIRLVLTTQSTIMSKGISGLLPVPTKGFIGNWFLLSQITNHLKFFRRKVGFCLPLLETPRAALLLVDAFLVHQPNSENYIPVSFRQPAKQQNLPFLDSHRSIVVISLRKFPTSKASRIKAVLELAMELGIIDGVLVYAAPTGLGSLGPRLLYPRVTPTLLNSPSLAIFQC